MYRCPMSRFSTFWKEVGKVFLCELTGRRAAAALLLGAVFLAYPHLAFVPLDGLCCGGAEGPVQVVQVRTARDVWDLSQETDWRVAPAAPGDFVPGTEEVRASASRVLEAFPLLRGLRPVIYIAPERTHWVEWGGGKGSEFAGWADPEVPRVGVFVIHTADDIREWARECYLRIDTDLVVAHELGHLADVFLLPKQAREAYFVLRSFRALTEEELRRMTALERYHADDFEIRAEDFAYLFGGEDAAWRLRWSEKWEAHALPAPGEPERVFWLAAAARAERWKEASAGDRR